MSKCWYCNNELTSGDSPKHFGICNKCYDKMFKSGDTIIRSLTNKITDLETKLAECESELEKQKEKYDKLYGCYKKTSSEDLQDKYSLAEENEQLKKQLTEKEEEYQSFKKIADENVNYLKNRILEETKNYNQDKISFAIEQLEKVKELLNTDFESIISWIDSYEDGECLNSMTYNHNNTIKIIDNQIKQLKDKNNG